MDISLVSMLMPNAAPAAGGAGNAPAESASGGLASGNPFLQMITGAVVPAAVVAAEPPVLLKQGNADIARQRASEMLSQLNVASEKVGFIKPEQDGLELPPIDVAAEVDPSLSDGASTDKDAEDDSEQMVGGYELLMVPPVLIYAEEDKPEAVSLDQKLLLSEVTPTQEEQPLLSDNVSPTPHEIEPKETAQRDAAHPLKLAFEAPVFPGIQEAVAPEEEQPHTEVVVDTFPAIEMTHGDEEKTPDAHLNAGVTSSNLVAEAQTSKQTNHVRPGVNELLQGMVAVAAPEEQAVSEVVADGEEKVVSQQVQGEVPAQLMGVVPLMNVSKPHKPETAENKVPVSIRSLEPLRRLVQDNDDVMIQDERVLEVMDEASDELEAMVERIVSQRHIPMTTVPVEQTAAELAGSVAKGTESDSFIQISAVSPSTSHKDVVSAQKSEAAMLQAYVPENRHITEQVHVSIRKAVDVGNDRVVLQLDPAHLGKVEVRMEMNAGGSAHVVITAENKATLDALQQDARYLERALQDSGIKADAGAMEFNLRHQNGYQNGSGMENASSSPREEILPPEVTSNGEADDETAVTTHYMVQVTDGIDIKV